MSAFLARPSTAFAGHRLIASGALADIAIDVKEMLDRDPKISVLVFDDATGKVIDLDLRGTKAEITARLAERESVDAPAGEQSGLPVRGRGRPKLGVVAREVTLLPRHWEWLARQRGGASHALRRLVDEARRQDGGRTRQRNAQESAYRFMSAMAGDLEGFEEAARALFAGNRDGFSEHMASWPGDVRAYADRLAWRVAAA